MNDKIVESVILKFNIRQPFSFSVLSPDLSLSGSFIYKVITDEGVFALKSYSQSSLAALQIAHTVLENSRKSGFVLFPLIVSNKDDQKVVYQNGLYWDLSCWIPGNVPDKSRLNLIQCVDKLIDFHCAVGLDNSEYGPIPGMINRFREIDSFSISSVDFSLISFLPISSIIEHLLWIRQELDILEVFPTPTVGIQFCWGDARRENILFENNELSGFVDYFAIRKDCKEVDVARMISSFAGDDYEMWTNGLDAYSRKSSIDYLLCRKLDILGTIVSLYRWLKWLQNPSPESILKKKIERFSGLFQRVKKWKEHGSLKSMLFYR
ncbi:MAG: hypothetical protein EBT92_07760 [Planctomycetes bacterium]|nr:hypothetical protein [Planctomycetota bacterium]